MRTNNYYQEKFGLYTFEEVTQYNYSFLDKIDIEPYINKFTDLDDVWDALEDDYDDTNLTNNEFLQGCIFNEIAKDELAVYIYNRYHIKYWETTKYIRH